MIKITEETLASLRADVMQRMSSKRFGHTVAVESMVARLCALFCPEQTLPMRAAALLHDITKECSFDEQLSLCERFGLPIREADRLAPKTFHARTAAALIAQEFPQFADPTVLSAVRWHTTGREGMTLSEQLLYLADYIDESRSFHSCVVLRRYFWGAEPQTMDLENRLRLLRDTMLMSFEMTVRDLLDEGRPIAVETAEARNWLLLQAAEEERKT